MDSSRTEITTIKPVALDTDGAAYVPVGPPVTLSPRERAIVFLMSHGLSNKQIARQLSIGPETVKSHAKRIYLKLTVRSRAQAVYRAATLGLIAL